MVRRTLNEETLEKIFQPLAIANARLSQRYPGDGPVSQPVHTVYGGAQLYKAGTTQKLGDLALRHMDTFTDGPQKFAKAVGLPPGASLREQVYERVKEKLGKCAVEDFRIDFEDGYGHRPDSEEDTTAEFAAQQVALALKDNQLPPFIGIRVKAMNEELRKRSIRTLDIFLSSLIEASGGVLPENFVVTLPKVNIPEQVECFVAALCDLEKSLGVAEGAIPIEIMIETTQAIIGPDGRCKIPEMVDAAAGRCRGAHFGTYDYTACSDISATEQKMDHLSCDFALHFMKVSLAGTGVWLSDGATSVMPVAPHSARDGELTTLQQEENLKVVSNAWQMSYRHIRHSLKKGFYQGWDLHPGQLPVRYAAMYSFFLEGLEQNSERLKNFIDKAAQATLVGDVFDDAATGQGLLNYFLRALSCGAISEQEVQATGLTLEELRSKSFVKIVKGRTQ